MLDVSKKFFRSLLEDTFHVIIITEITLRLWQSQPHLFNIHPGKFHLNLKTYTRGDAFACVERKHEIEETCYQKHIEDIFQSLICYAKIQGRITNKQFFFFFVSKIGRLTFSSSV